MVKGDSIQHFDRFFNDDLTFDTMLERIKNMVDKTPVQISNIIKVACLVGLRPAEVVQSVRLINDKETLQTYYKPERNALEHFRFPSIFLRQTKKAYISFVSPEIMDIAKAVGTCNISYNTIRLSCFNQSMACDMRFCRKIYASHLRQYGIQAEIIDMLQGRVAQSVLVKHYLVPKPSYKEDVIKAITELRRMVT